MQKSAEEKTMIESTPESVVVDTHASLRSLALGAVCVSVLVLVLLSIIFYFGYVRLEKNTYQLHRVIQEYKDHLTSAQNQFSGLQKTIAELQQNSQNQLSSQQQMINEIRNAQHDKREGWVVAEAQYLTKLANDNLQVGDNVVLVIKLLQSADQTLRDLSDAQLLPIRKALAEDILALQNIPQVDLSGTYLQLSAMNDQVDKLSIPNKHVMNNDKSGVTDAKSKSWWREALQETGDMLSKIVVIRYHNAHELPFIAPDQQANLYLNMHAQFELAMWGVVHKQPQIFQASLQQIEIWIKQYFVVDDTVALTMLNNINQLKLLNIRPDLPNLTASLDAFKNYLASQETPSEPAATQDKQ